jgi:hypothetical protein
MDFEFNVPLAFGDAPACIVYMPEGEHFINASIGGRQKVIVDRSCLEALQRDLALKLTQNVRPVCYFDHKTGPASLNVPRVIPLSRPQRQCTPLGPSTTANTDVPS